MTVGRAKLIPLTHNVQQQQQQLPAAPPHGQNRYRRVADFVNDGQQFGGVILRIESLNSRPDLEVFIRFGQRGPKI